LSHQPNIHPGNIPAPGRVMSLVHKGLGRHAGVWSAAAVLLGQTAIGAGCQPIQTGFDSPAPTKRIDAIVQASELQDTDSLGRLIEQLESEDPAARMLAIRALEIRTGTTLGYDHAAPRWQRIEAVNRWINYLNEREATPTATEHNANGQAPSDQPMKNTGQVTPMID